MRSALRVRRRLRPTTPVNNSGRRLQPLPPKFRADCAVAANGPAVAYARAVPRHACRTLVVLDAEARWAGVQLAANESLSVPQLSDRGSVEREKEGAEAGAGIAVTFAREPVPNAAAPPWRIDAAVLPQASGQLPADLLLERPAAVAE